MSLSPQFILRSSIRATLTKHPDDFSITRNDCKNDPVRYARDALDEIENMTFADKYSEPGYDDPKKCVLFANWNYFYRGIDDILERAGYAIEWSDEWTVCENCNGAIRTSPDSHQWKRSYWLDENDRGGCAEICINCVIESASERESYVDAMANNHRKAITIDEIDPCEFGYELISSDHQQGIREYYDPDDKPETIYSHLKDHGYADIVFKMTDNDQFDITFTVYARKESKEQS